MIILTILIAAKMILINIDKENITTARFWGPL